MGGFQKPSEIAPTSGDPIGSGLQFLGQVLNQRDTKKSLLLANKNLSSLENRGVQDTASDEVKNAYRSALDLYKLRQSEAVGYSEAEKAQLTDEMNRGQLAQLTQGREASGGQMSKYLGNVLNTNKQNSLLSLASDSAALKLRQKAQADSLLGNIQQGANVLQSQKNFDLGNYREDLSAAGKAISDLRMQKLLNRSGVFSSAGNFIKDTGKSASSGMQGLESEIETSL